MTTKKTYEPTSWEAKFLELYRASCSVSVAAFGAGISRAAVYQRRKQYKTFASLWDEAKKEAVERLEAAAWQRAKDSSDTLLIFLLKANKPRKYRENLKITIEGGLSVDIINQTIRALEDAGLSASDIFNELIREAAHRQAVSAESDRPAEDPAARDRA